MCGIAGIISLKNETKFLPGSLLSMSQQIKWRGPDDEGYLLADSQNIRIFDGPDSSTKQLSFPYIPTNKLHPDQKTPFSIGLVHRRLSILDLSDAGHQPMCDDSQKIWIVYNGEIYNYKELRSRLEKAGYQFRTNTDTEVLLYAYRHWGIESLHKFNGMFAFAILDLQKNQVIIARDRIGIKPVFYYTDGEKLLFGSNARSIVFSGLYKKKLNYQGLWLNLAYGFSVKPLTVFDGIFMLEPGHFLKIDLDTGIIEKRQWWKLQTFKHSDKITDISTALSHLEEILQDSIRYRLIADVEVATFLSGGIDSGLITTLADKIHSGIKAFTLTFPVEDRTNDELERAITVARYNKLNQIIINLDTNDTLSFLDNIVLGYEEPFPQLAPNFLLSHKVKEQGIKIILTGLGADEIFAGYGWYRGIKKWQILRYLTLGSKLLPANNKKNIKLRYSRRPRDWSEIYGLMFTVFPDGLIRQLLPGIKPIDSLGSLSTLLNPYGLELHTPVETYNYYDLMLYLGSHNLYHTDQFFMDNSVEGRVPFLDHRLLELSFMLDDSLKLGPKMNETKYLVKLLAEKYLPHDIIYRRKLGFNMPIDVWVGDKLKSFISQNIQDLKIKNILDPIAIDKIIKLGQPQQIWHLVMVNLWYKKFFEENS